MNISALVLPAIVPVGVAEVMGLTGVMGVTGVTEVTGVTGI